MQRGLLLALTSSNYSFKECYEIGACECYANGHCTACRESEMVRRCVCMTAVFSHQEHEVRFKASHKIEGPCLSTGFKQASWRIQSHISECITKLHQTDLTFSENYVLV